MLPSPNQIKKVDKDLDTQYTYVGIDFGTSTTVVSIAFGGSANSVTVKSLPIVQQDQSGGKSKGEKVPTCIAYSRRYNEIYIGQGAYEARFDGKVTPGRNVWFEFKTLLGEDVGPRYTQSLLDGKEGRPLLETATDAAAIFLEHISKEVEKEVNELKLPPTIKYVVSVPASFEANQRQDLLNALKRAGIAIAGESMLIDEPNAAFLSYMEQSTRSKTGRGGIVLTEDETQNLMVFDFGAGTCDISVLQIGKDSDGELHSKNLAISHYTEIGGKDIDLKIAELLLSRVTPVNSKNPPVFELPGNVRRKMSQQLLRIAEQLKIELCKNVTYVRQARTNTDATSLGANSGIAPELKDNRDQVYLSPLPSLSYKEFDSIMKPYVAESGIKSVMKPINSALSSAGLEREEIHYVLMVGGSAQNPWIQDALSTAFPDAEFLYPEDMQALVSQGAAIHSYYLHALGHRLIRPITGPSIRLRLHNGEWQTLVPSGTEIPFAGNEIHGFSPQRNGQKALELPICLTSEDYILQVLRIEPAASSTFNLSDRISLAVKITADKTLHVAAKVSSGEAVVTQLNPYSSKALSTRERIAAEARKQFNSAVRRNGGEPTASQLIALSEALKKAKEEIESAELLEEAYQKSPSAVSLNNLGVAWDRAGRRDKAVIYYEEAFENGEVYAGVNLAIDFRFSDKKRYKELLTKAYKMRPNDYWVLFNYGQMLKDEGDELWKVQWRKVFEIFIGEMKDNSLSLDNANRALTVANALGEEEAANHIRQYQKRLKGTDVFFDEENTIQQAQPDRTPVVTF